MAEISRGPVSTLPGHAASLPTGTMCDCHSDRLAVARVQGETDSFGCEYNDLCKECLDGERSARESERSGTCEWCKSTASDLRDKRDYDEGFSGRVYRVCGECVKAENKRFEENSSYDDYYDYGDGDD